MAFDTKQFPNLTVLDHPLITHKITRMRKITTKTNEFRILVKEVAMLEGYEALKDMPLREVEIETPVEKTVAKKINTQSICFVPILRAGLGMADGMAELIPGAPFGHIGLYRNEETHEPVEYYCKLPNNIAEKRVVLIDPMLATAGSALGAVELLRKHGVKDITFICIIAAPEGVERFCKTRR